VEAVTEAIDAVFTALREAVATIIQKAKEAAVGLINAARSWVVDKLNGFREWAKSQVDKYLKESFPGLANAINSGINFAVDGAVAGVNFVADTAIAGVEALANGLAAALDKILSVYQAALKAAVQIAGAVVTGDFAEALKIAIQAACDIAGIDSKPIFDFFDRAGSLITSILKDPLSFINNLMSAVGQGVRQFGENILAHLQKGLIAWLTGAIAEAGITLPEKWDLLGIFGLVAQILGLTYANVKARIIKKLPAAETVFDTIEKGFELVMKLKDLDFSGLWEEAKTALANLQETVIGGIRNWVITTVIKEGIIWLLSLMNPASAIVKALKVLFDLVMWLVERFQQIKDFVLSVYDAVAKIAAGVLDPAAKAVEDALSRALPVVISMVASFIGLGGVGKAVKGILEKITAPINKVIAFAKKIIAKVKSGVQTAKEKAKETAAKLLDWWKAKSGFTDESGESHTLSYQGSKSSAQLMVASSNPLKIEEFLKDRLTKAKAGGTPYSVGDVTLAQDYYKKNIEPAEDALQKADVGGPATKKGKGADVNKALADTLQTHLDTLGTTWLKKFFDPKDVKDFPPPQLPVMADNVRARTLRADYIIAGDKRKNGYKYKVKQGTESTAHVGNLEGWPDLQGAKLTTGSKKYVRMHLLPHKLGGDAVDSNLTPARGDLFNTPFSAAVEQPAIKAAIEAPPTQIQPIWYRFEIGYYPSTTPPPAAWTPGATYPAEAFPNRIHAEWGFYEPRATTSTEIKPGKIEYEKTETPLLPDLASIPPAINREGPTPLLSGLRKQDSAITPYFVTDILIKNRPYSSKTSMKDTLWLKGSSARAETRRRYVNATYVAASDAKKYVTMD